MLQPKISIVVPIYGVEAYLKECVDSILAQTFQDIEVILVDDGSKDNCPQICDEYASKDNRIVVIHQPNGGYSRAVNHGLEVAKAPYIGIVEPDDYIEPKMYELLYNEMIKTNADFVKAGYAEFFPDGIVKVHDCRNYCHIPVGAFHWSECPDFVRFHPSIWTCLYRKELLFNNNIKMTEVSGAAWTDNLFQLQTFLLARSMSYISDSVYHYRRRSHRSADELKNYNTPLDRIEEMNAWLNSQEIQDKNLWGCYYKKILGYFRLVAQVAPFKELSQAKERIQPLVQQMDRNIVLNSHVIALAEKKFYKALLKHPLRTLFRAKYPWCQRRFFFNLKTRKGIFCLQLLGVQISYGKFPELEAWVRLNLKKEK